MVYLKELEILRDKILTMKNEHRISKETEIKIIWKLNSIQEIMNTYRSQTIESKKRTRELKEGKRVKIIYKEMKSKNGKKVIRWKETG